MEKMSHESAEQIPENLRHLYSDDPYEVLGIKRDATEDEIKKARGAAQMKYHSDQDRSEGATIRSQNINIAYSKLKGTGRPPLNNKTETPRQEERPQQKPSEPPKSAKPQPETRPEPEVKNEQKIHSDKEAEDSFVAEVELMWNYPKECADHLSYLQKQGFETRGLLQLERVKAILINKTLSAKIVSGGKKNADAFQEYVTEWEGYGVTYLRDPVKRPDVKDFLLIRAAEFLEIKTGEGLGLLLDFAESWQKAGADYLGEFVKTDVVRKYIADEFVGYIQYIDNERIKTNFIYLNDIRKRLGIDISDFLNTEEMNHTLKRGSGLRYLAEDPSRVPHFKNYVWYMRSAGWTPDDYVERAVQRYGSL